MYMYQLINLKLYIQLLELLLVSKFHVQIW